MSTPKKTDPIDPTETVWDRDAVEEEVTAVEEEVTAVEEEVTAVEEEVAAAKEEVDARVGEILGAATHSDFEPEPEPDEPDESAPEPEPEPDEHDESAPEPIRRKLKHPRRRQSSGSVLAEKVMIGVPLVGLAVAGLTSYMAWKGIKKVFPVILESGKRLLTGLGTTLFQAGETVFVNPFRFIGRVVGTPFSRASEYYKKGLEYPTKPSTNIVSRALYRGKQAALGGLFGASGFAFGAIEGIGVGVARDMAGVQWSEASKDSKEGEKAKKISFDKGGFMGVAAALAGTVKGVLYDGPKAAFAANQVPSEVKGESPVTQQNPEFVGDLTRAAKSLWKIMKADNANDADIEAAIDDAVDLLNLERYGAVWAMAGTAIMAIKKRFWPSIQPSEVQWDNFGDQFQGLNGRSERDSFLKAAEPRILARKFRLLINRDRLDLALTTEKGREEAKKQLGTFLGRKDEEIDMQELEEDLNAHLDRIGQLNDISSSVRANASALIDLIENIFEILDESRLKKMYSQEEKKAP